jgi:hypothetical protein
MTRAALRASQAFPCVARALLARYSAGPQPLANARAVKPQEAAHFARLSRSSPSAQDWLQVYRNPETMGSLLLQMVRSAPRRQLDLPVVH